MATPIQMPALSPTMTEGKLTKWLKKEGDKISAGDAIAEIETDKSNLEVEAYEDGSLLKSVVKEGESAPVGAPIAYVGEKGEKVSAEAAPASRAPTPAPAEERPRPPSAQDGGPSAPREPLRAPPQPAPKSVSSAGGQVVPLRREEAAEAEARLRASPLAKRM